MNVAVQGKSYPDATFIADAALVERFRRAVGASGDAVPPTFVTVAEFSALPRIVADPELALDFSRVLHAEQEYELTRPLRVGETLVVRSRIAQARARGGNAFLTIETELVDADGGVVAVARATMLERESA